MKRLLHHFTIAALLAAAAVATAGQAYAAATPWAEDAGGRMRLIVSPPADDGTIQAALQVEPEDGFITYWREPGESGIPPQITVSGTGNAHLETIEYPVPKRLSVAGMTDMGYDAPVTFPLILKTDPGALPSLSVNAFIGLCKDICIPFQTTFDIPADADAFAETPVDKAILAVARTRLPEQPSEGFHADDAMLTDSGMRILLTLPNGSSESEITLANSNGFIVEAEARPFEDGGFVVDIPLSALPEDADPMDGDWLLLVKSDGRAMETPLVITP
ncbi:protein-disulfide reductase DsbD domain-containing protein [uncultured Martelella sp.]|uniref:protein-disulfide reductase DsbD domain-containing protein n=1 Tax=uncultured Martelella sp. TaxID=392331 RepID=UPI0029C8BBB9|nr:protein-disulfide reductase DsbD domain-containing protein [uncultured Martelella sp.]